MTSIGETLGLIATGHSPRRSHGNFRRASNGIFRNGGVIRDPLVAMGK
jgi:hypothetical protein